MNVTAQIRMTPIGSIEHEKDGTVIKLRKGMGKALTGLDGFSHAIILWNFDRAQWEEGMFTYTSPYKSFSGELGIFATRGPFRPNGIALSICRVISCDIGGDSMAVDWIEAEPHSPVLDIKPFHPSSDVITDPGVPDWCSHWPKNRESSGSFDWEAEFAF